MFRPQVAQSVMMHLPASSPAARLLVNRCRFFGAQTRSRADAGVPSWGPSYRLHVMSSYGNDGQSAWLYGHAC